MVTASGGVSPPFTHYTTPYVITNLTGSPGDVGIYLPGSSSEMLAFFNVASASTAPAGAMAISSYVFGSLNGNGLNGLNSARGTYVNPSNFAARDAAMFANGANIPVSLRYDGQSPPATVGYANQLMVTADSVGANTLRISDLDFLRHRHPLRVRHPPSGVSGAPSTAQTTPTVNSRSRIKALSCSGSAAFRQRSAPSLRRPARPLTPATPSPISRPARAAITYLAAGTFSAAVNFGARNGAITIGGLDGTNYAGTASWVQGTTTFATAANSPLMGSNLGRTAALNGSFFQGGRDQRRPRLYGEMGGSLILNGTGGYLGGGIFAARR